MDAIKKRRSVRKFKPKEVTNELIEKLIDAARWAPSGMNSQPWQFIVIKDKEKLRKIAKMYKKAREKLKVYPQDTSFIEHTTLILICTGKEMKWGKTDCYLAIQNILLAATDLSLGSLCIGALIATGNINELKEMCSIPANVDIVLPVAIGYADETPEHKPRKNIKEILHYEEF